MNDADGGRAVVGETRGFTLVELLVVLVVMMIGIGVVAPALFTAGSTEPEPELARLVRFARGAAASRGETLYLRIGASGDWLLEGATSASQGAGAVARGSVSDYPGPTATIVVSPVGTCAFDVRSTEAWSGVELDPMVCEIVPS